MKNENDHWNRPPDLKTVFLWGYHGLYPVAKIEGMTKTAVYNALGNTVTELLALQRHGADLAEC